MNYYKQGDAANAERIKAAFKKLGIDALDFGFADKTVVYCSIGGACVQSLPYSINLMHILYSHPDYKELELPVEHKFKFKVGDWIVQNDNGTVSQVTKVINGIDEYGEYRAYDHTNGYFAACFENEYHLWTIKDAKDGDVLSLNGKPFIYSYKYGKNYCYIDNCGQFRANFNLVLEGNCVCPATKQERDLLFSKMRKVGYQWDADKKELRKIIEPKFKVGDKIQAKASKMYVYTVLSVDLQNQIYIIENDYKHQILFTKQDNFELVPQKHYDIANFQPFDKVLVRDNSMGLWSCTWYSHYIERTKSFYCGGFVFNQCIPYKGNEALLGTTGNPSEEYINW